MADKKLTYAQTVLEFFPEIFSVFVTTGMNNIGSPQEKTLVEPGVLIAESIIKGSINAWEFETVERVFSGVACLYIYKKRKRAIGIFLFLALALREK